MGEILIWLADCNFHFFTLSKLVLRYESCYCICTLYLKVTCKTKNKIWSNSQRTKSNIWSHSHYTSPLSGFVQLYNFYFKMVLSRWKPVLCNTFPSSVYSFYQTSEQFYEHGKFCGFLLLWTVCRACWLRLPEQHWVCLDTVLYELWLTRDALLTTLFTSFQESLLKLLRVTKACYSFRNKLEQNIFKTSRTPGKSCGISMLTFGKSKKVFVLA